LENYSTSQTYRTEIIRMINKIKHKIWATKLHLHH
jgi:hypothetical protein